MLLDYVIEGLPNKEYLRDAVRFDVSAVYDHLNHAAKFYSGKMDVDPYLRDAVCYTPFTGIPMWLEFNSGMFEGDFIREGCVCGSISRADTPKYASDIAKSLNVDMGQVHTCILFNGYAGKFRGGVAIEVMEYEWTGVVFINHDGGLIKRGALAREDSRGMYEDEAQIHSSTMLYSFDLLNARTEVDEITPSRAEKRQAARAFGQKGTYPLRNYYMLKVKPQKPGYTGPPQPLRQSGIGKRLHAVRGHFRRVPDTGLFGRGDKAGELLWIPNHTRGDSSLGEIVKGYKVEPGDN